MTGLSVHEEQITELGRATDRGEASALSLVGATIGDLEVTGRVKPARRWRYTVLDRRTGRTRFLRGYEVVRTAKSASTNGLPVVMPRHPWEDRQ